MSYWSFAHTVVFLKTISMFADGLTCLKTEELPKRSDFITFRVQKPFIFKLNLLKQDKIAIFFFENVRSI